MMPILDLTDEEQRVVIMALVEAPLPWKLTNPILVKMQQMQHPLQPVAQANSGNKKHERRIPDQP